MDNLNVTKQKRQRYGYQMCPLLCFPCYVTEPHASLIHNVVEPTRRKSHKLILFIVAIYLRLDHSFQSINARSTRSRSYAYPCWTCEMKDNTFLPSLTRDPLYSHPTNHLDVVPTERKIWSPTSSIYEGCTGWPSILPFCTHLHVTDPSHSIHPSAMVPLDEISYTPTHVQVQIVCFVANDHMPHV